MRSSSVAQFKVLINGTVHFTISDTEPLHVHGVNAEAAVVDGGGVAFDPPITLPEGEVGREWAAKMQRVLTDALMQYVAAEQRKLVQKDGMQPTNLLVAVVPDKKTVH